MAVTLAACGGGGGGGGGSGTLGGGTDGNGSKNKFHHDAEVGKWGSGNSTGGGFGENGGTLGGINDIYINGNPSLDVTGYTFNGTTYSDLKDFAKAIFESGTTEDVFYVNFNVNGESAPRTARIRANGAANPGDDLTIDYQYKLTYTVPSVGGTAGSTQEVFFYKRDGASINLPVLSDSVYTNQGGIDYHANKWDVQGQVVSGGNVRINATGDATISNITQVADTSYGFRSSDNTLVVNSTGTVAVNASGRSDSITKIELPASGSVALDLSSVTNVALTGTLSGSTATPCVTNPQTLVSISLPESSFSIGTCAFDGCINLAGFIDLTNCTSLGERAFRRCGITSVTIGSSITTIPDYAFIYCNNLSGSINLSHCTSIGQSAFKSCPKITSVNLSNCTSIGAGAFQNCTALTSINMPICTSIGHDTFWNDSELTSIDLSSCTTIDQNAFNNCTKLANVTLGNSLTTIGVGTFYNVPSVAVFTFAKDPTSFTYSNYINTTDGVNYSTFKNGATATWNGNTYTWNESANGGSGGWDPF